MHNAGFEDIPFKFHYSGNYNVILISATLLYKNNLKH